VPKIPQFYSMIRRRKTTSLKVVFRLLPGDDLLSQELCPKYPWPWNERHDSLRWRVSPSHLPQRNTSWRRNEPFATLRLVTHSPAVWILNFRVRYTKSTIVSSGEYRRATHPKGTLRGEGMSFSPHCVP